MFGFKLLDRECGCTLPKLTPSNTHTHSHSRSESEETVGTEVRGASQLGEDLSFSHPFFSSLPFFPICLWLSLSVFLLLSPSLFCLFVYLSFSLPHSLPTVLFLCSTHILFGELESGWDFSSQDLTCEDAGNNKVSWSFINPTSVGIKVYGAVRRRPKLEWGERTAWTRGLRKRWVSHSSDGLRKVWMSHWSYS